MSREWKVKMKMEILKIWKVSSSFFTHLCQTFSNLSVQIFSFPCASAPRELFHCHSAKIATPTSFVQTFDFARLLFCAGALWFVFISQKCFLTIGKYLWWESSVVLRSIVQFCVNFRLFRQLFDVFGGAVCRVIRNSLEWRKSNAKNVIDHKNKLLHIWLSVLACTRRAKIFKWYNRADTRNSTFHEPQKFALCFLSICCRADRFELFESD